MKTFEQLRDEIDELTKNLVYSYNKEVKEENERTGKKRMFVWLKLERTRSDVMSQIFGEDYYGS